MSEPQTEFTIEQRVNALEQRAETLEQKRPGRRLDPIVETVTGVCGIDPTIDSATCEKASIYRYQQGCKGTMCIKKNREYYADYRNKKKQVPTVEVAVEVPSGTKE